jgi:protein subunit release factor B
MIPKGDYFALDDLSELVSVLPNVELRGLLLTEIALSLNRAKGKTRATTNQVALSPTTGSSAASTKTVELVEEELTETFVRGSGPGGQKVNKTSNRVVLVHEPTQLRVECQDTRSLQQNRKIARKRLAEKLDEYLNGQQSKVSQKVQKTIDKKQKQKSKNRARLKKKQLEKHLEQLEQTGGSYENDFY